jgi:hypothetical protein
MLFNHLYWELSEGINLDLNEEAIFTVGSGVSYENLGTINANFRATLVVSYDAVFINKGEINMSSIRVNHVNAGGTFINEGSIYILDGLMAISGYFENNGLVHISSTGHVSHIWVGNAGMEASVEARGVNNGEIIIEDTKSSLSVRSGVLVNNAGIVNYGEIIILNNSELIIGSEGTIENNRSFARIGSAIVTIEDGGSITGGRIVTR